MGNTKWWWKVVYKYQIQNESNYEHFKGNAAEKISGLPQVSKLIFLRECVHGRW